MHTRRPIARGKPVLPEGRAPAGTDPLSDKAHGDGFPDAAKPAQGEAPDPNQNERSSHLTDQVAELSLCVPDVESYSCYYAHMRTVPCVSASRQHRNRPRVLKFNVAQEQFPCALSPERNNSY